MEIRSEPERRDRAHQGIGRGYLAQEQAGQYSNLVLDLEGLQARAAEEGVPYQTLMASVLHKFVSGRLVEAQKRITTRSSRTARKRTAA